jgi:hypothetical protein
LTKMILTLLAHAWKVDPPGAMEHAYYFYVDFGLCWNRK